MIEAESCLGRQAFAEMAASWEGVYYREEARKERVEKRSSVQGKKGSRSKVRRPSISEMQKSLIKNKIQ